MTSNEPNSWIPAIDATLERWSQGDCTVGEDCWFVTRFDPLLAEALARKRSRFAFPDDFNEFAKELQKRMQKRHDKADDDGVALRALREIRVRAAPAWDAERVELMFWFIRAEEDVLFKNKAWHELLDEWLKLLPPSARFSAVDGTVVSLDDMTAKDYLHSDRLDLDRLSSH